MGRRRFHPNEQRPLVGDPAAPVHGVEGGRRLSSTLRVLLGKGQTRATRGRASSHYIGGSPPASENSSSRTFHWVD
jgi:hypothetical protein